MVFIVPLLIMATSLVSKINTRVALLKGWVNSFLAFMGQLYLGFYRTRSCHSPREDEHASNGPFLWKSSLCPIKYCLALWCFPFHLKSTILSATQCVFNYGNIG